MISPLKKSVSVFALFLILMGAGVSAAHAKATPTASVSDSVSASDNNKQSELQSALRGGDPVKVATVAVAMIDGRIAILNELASDIASFKHVSASDKSALTAQVQTNLDAMNTLRVNIQKESGSTTVSAALRDDATSITKNYRIGILIHPQVKRVLAADRIETLYALFTDLATKLQSRITAMNAISDTDAKSRAQAALDDLKQQIENANGNAIKAEADVAGLKPDQGDKGVLGSNKAQLDSATTSLGNARAQLTAARKDADTLVAILKGKR